MENNELDTNVSEIENIDSSNDETSDENHYESNDYNDLPTVEDYKELQRKNKELFERAKKAEALAKAKKEANINKTNNNNQSSLSREEAILFAKGYTDEEVQLACKVAKIENISILAAAEDNYVKAKVDSRLSSERAEKASLPASNGSNLLRAEKPLGEMTDEEHAEHYYKVMGL